jgi:hypothetical protein
VRQERALSRRRGAACGCWYVGLPGSFGRSSLGPAGKLRWLEGHRIGSGRTRGTGKPRLGVPSSTRSATEALAVQPSQRHRR